MDAMLVLLKFEKFDARAKSEACGICRENLKLQVIYS